MLSGGARTAGELGGAFALSAPAISKHLRVLRECRVVDEQRGQRDARQRVYRLRHESLEAVDGWLAEVRRFWTLQLQAFADHVELDAAAAATRSGAVAAPRRRPRNRPGGGPARGTA